MIDMATKSYECCILGAGPAGLGAALELVRHDVRDVLIVERNSMVGGLARTYCNNSARFDIGPHRFFTKNREVNKIWHDILGEDFKLVSRITRIFYQNKFFYYPIRPFDILRKLSPLESINIMFSFVLSQFNKRQDALTFEDWIIAKFGYKLYKTFFKVYTEKVWGIPCSQISAQWASQRIRGLDALQLIKSFFAGKQKSRPRTLVEQFEYPVLGSGQMYEAMSDRILSQGAHLMLDSKVVGFNHKDNAIKSINVIDAYGKMVNISARQFFSSIPLVHFFNMLNPPESRYIMKSVEALRYRDHITVNLLANKRDFFSDQWIYVHMPDVQMARVVNYNNFSKAMVHKKDKSALSVEYFVFKDDGLWNESDEFLKDLAVEELSKMGLAQRSDIEDSWVIREAEAYPMAYVGFQEHYDLLKSRIDKFINLFSIGRAGMHRYNNQDHSIMSGMLAARNYLKISIPPYNLWDINTDTEYLEGITASR
jgi:protoporphyrinogen oxidase